MALFGMQPVAFPSIAGNHLDSAIAPCLFAEILNHLKFPGVILHGVHVPEPDINSFERAGVATANRFQHVVGVCPDEPVTRYFKGDTCSWSNFGSRFTAACKTHNCVSR